MPRVGAFVLAVSLCLSIPVSACSLGRLQHDVDFEPLSTALGVDEAKALAEWFIDWRDGLGVEYAIVVAKSVRGEPRSLDLATLRMRGIARILDALNTDNVKITYADSFMSSGIRHGLGTVTIAVQPGCAKTDTCCPQPPAK
ncbi:hypothetical protein [Diaphorobacter aerolatus]|uniref:OmpA family protein n=1 Tax=Diaphorobacter aerolatus TaxID=1288495 RepID=A0A7H0GL74_9BURK|nr:hypothetical protein [Diaphorobacter aerolatus]QNP49040.1 hypothetical protein H9K75_02450 [Diaphorobacter aerolatus]